MLNVDIVLDMLGSLDTLLKRGELAYKNYIANGKTLLHAKVIKNNNEQIRALILQKMHFLPFEQHSNAIDLVAHIDIWLVLWEDLYASKTYDLNEEFAFENDATFPKASVASLYAFYSDQLAKQNERKAMRIFYGPPEYSSKQVLADCGLPTSDLGSAHFDDFIGCGSPEDLKGVVGLELFGSVALLRSLAVIKVARGLGCAKKLVFEAENRARESGIKELYLLTTTAEKFFSNVEYVQAERNAAPEQIKSTTEFSGLCPVDATFMVKQL